MRIGILMVALSVVFPFSSPVHLSASGNDAAVQMRVKRLLLDPASKTPVVILESTQEKDFVPIWIGRAEATSIAMELEHVRIPRPNTHDLIRNILQGLGATLERITVTEVRNNTYFAVVTLKLNGQKFQIDSRPSDAIAVALRMKAPIYASPDVLAKAGKLPGPFEHREGVRKILGFHIQNLTAELATFFNLKNRSGVLVADVEMGGTASKAGFQRGDVITRINDQTVHNVSQLESLLKSIKKPVQVRMEIQRKGGPVTLVMDLPT
ncbi:MAG: bifunctional nuclease domain-containing protein [Candidatus Binatia bacterium]